MKKFKIIMAILVISTLMITGCSNVQTPNETNETKKNESEVPDQSDLNEELSDTDSNSEGSSGSKSSEEDMGEIFYGQVKSIVGNEIEMEMGVLPDWSEGEDMKPGDKKKPGSSQEEVTIKENPPGQEDYFAPDPDSSIFGEDGEINLTYTGENRNVIIPAGVDIRNILGGKATLDEIKKGSILMIKQKGTDDKGLTIDMLTILK